LSPGIGGGELAPGEGNERFWQFAVDLRSPGVKLEQIDAALEVEASNGRSPKDARRK